MSDVQGTGGPVESTPIEGKVDWVLTGPDGEVKHRGTAFNIITQVGDQMYAERGAGLAGAPAVPTGMKLGTGSTAAAKTGAGAALVTYLANSHQAFSGNPASAVQGSARRITYTAVFGAGKATSGSNITEAVIVNEALTDATSAAAATVSRVILSGPAPKGASDTLTLTWTHDIGS